MEILHGKRSIYINGIIEGALYELGVLRYCDQGICYYDCLDEFKYVSSIIAVQQSGNTIIGGVGYGDPQFLSIINDEFFYDFYDIYAGMNNEDGTYKITNIDLRSEYISQNYEKLGVAVPLGALLVKAGFSTIPISKLILITGSISTETLSLALSWYKFDSYYSYDIYVDIYVSQKVYEYGSTKVNIPLMFLKIYAYPSREN